jgi:hypothetical protein
VLPQTFRIPARGAELERVEVEIDPYAMDPEIDRLTQPAVELSWKLSRS